MTQPAEGRWLPSLEALLALAPGVRDLLETSHQLEEVYGRGDLGDGEVLKPVGVWFALTLAVMDAGKPRLDLRDFWRSYLAYVELAAESEDELRRLSADPDDDEDVRVLNSFVDAGVICDITRDRDGFLALLPYLGPRLVSAAHREVGVHGRVSDDWGGRDIDWSRGGTEFRPLNVPPQELWPLDRW